MEHVDTSQTLDGSGLIDPHHLAGLALQTIHDLEVS